ncbi:RNA polymerase sigma factor [Halodesulfovibrio spirochaetisodalis]|uniref:RNA polymerase n=1 Tax=Halodesulfovibrio spirochaetisodalis TaxID=1560234 RepID=A0A1B7XEQ2_9BACT|nr:RNA polymerase sigma factor [Halodesulfovibrio spirochaetisodalis]OBQ52653.1 RNA polymerase [Halodesulfovibrio spirochaetisodalis]
MTSVLDDWIIISAVLEGDTAAYAQIIDRHTQHVSTLVGKHVPFQHVAEVSHETFVRAYRSLGSYTPEKPFKRWLSAIAIRSSTDFWRAHYRKKETPLSEFTDDSAQWLDAVCLADSENEFDRLSKAQEAKEVLEMVLGSLRPLDRMALVMTQLEGYSGKETAELLGISSASVKVRVFRAKHGLKTLLKKHGIERA